MVEKPLRPLVLASASPRRQALLEQIGLAFSVRPVDVDEAIQPGEDPAHYVERLARDKAQAGMAAVGHGDALVLGADTTVVCDGDILTKPVDRDDGIAMLRRLSGRSHKVMTAVALAGQYGCYARLAVTEVHFRPLAEIEMQRYWLTDEPRDKAGGYAIQGRAAVFVSEIHGSYSAVVGLPLQETAELLVEAKQPVWSVWGAGDIRGDGND